VLLLLSQSQSFAAKMTALWGGSNNPQPQQPAEFSKDIADVADVGLPNLNQQPFTEPSAGRPQLQRNQPQPPPPHQPPPPPDPQQQLIGNPNDSLSLMQLRRIVTEFPRIEPIAYAFTYADTASYEEEVDEWFSYNESEYARLRTAKNTFSRRWKKFDVRGWADADGDTREAFTQREITGLQATDLRRRCKSLQTLLHISLGVWDESAGIERAVSDTNGPGTGDTKARSAATKSQIEAIQDGVRLITESGGVSHVYELMKRAFDRLW
jgi:N1221-like protein